MYSILSATEHDYYAFPLPFTVWSWNKIGIPCIIFVPANAAPKLQIAKDFISTQNKFIEFSAPEHKIPTYSQTSRLFGACEDLPEDEVLITGDADLCVFGDYLLQANLDVIQIFGADLVPENQFPMCFISMPVKYWRQVMGINPRIPPQCYLDSLLGPMESVHFRSDLWALDQDTAYRKITASNLPIIKHNRASYPHKFATRRNDRDGWQSCLPENLIDAHLPRVGYAEENFNKIITLLKQVYPDENFNWMIKYHREYVKLLDV